MFLVIRKREYGACRYGSGCALQLCPARRSCAKGF
jgi:hypothetical protein